MDAASLEILERFECEWQAGNRPAIRPCLAALDGEPEFDGRRDLLHELIAIDLWHRWTSAPKGAEADELSDRPCLDEYARVFTDAGPLERMPAALIREEYRVRRMHGEAVTPADYRLRFAARDDLLPMLKELESEIAVQATVEFDRRNGEGRSTEPEVRRELHHFKLLEPLGSGGFGTVWRARDTKLQRDVAIKVPRRGQLTPAETELFLREARSTAQLRHPGIVAVYEVAVADDVPYIVSELVQGEPLSEHLKRRRYTSREAAILCAKTAEALHHAHKAGVVHRDLKPANLLLDEMGAPRLTDFGLARREGAEATLTADGQIMGTPAYMSPEQARGESHTADRRSDVYSLGVILYEMLTGERPFRGNATMIMIQIMNDEPASPRKFVGGLPRDLETICLKCLQKKPASRYSTAGELADDLGRFLRGAPIKARPIGPLERALKLCRAHPLATSFVGSTVLFLSILVALLAAWSIQSSRQVAEVKRNEASARNSYGLARGLLDETITDVQESLQHVPAADEARKKIIDQALEKRKQLDTVDNRFGATDELEVKGYFSLGRIYLGQGDIKQASDVFRQGHELAEARARQNPHDMLAIQAVGVSHWNLGELQIQNGNRLEARKEFEMAIEILEQVHPSPKYALAKIYLALGALCVELRDLAKAQSHYDRTFKLRMELLETDPGDFHRKRDLWEAILGQGDVQTALFNLVGAGQHYSKAVHMAEANVKADSLTYFLSLDDVATSCERLATCVLDQCQVEQAVELYDKALALREQLAAQNPANTHHRRALAVLRDRRGMMWYRLLNADRASDEYRKAFDIRQKLVADGPHNRLFQRDYLLSHLSLARAEEQRENFDEAIRWYDKGLQLCESLNADRAIESQSSMAEIKYWLVNGRQGCDLKRRTADEWETIRAKEPGIAELLQARAVLLARRGDFAGAESAADELAALAESQPPAFDFAAYAFARLAELAGERVETDTVAADLAARRKRFSEKAMTLLDAAYEAGLYDGPVAVHCLRYSHGLDSLRSRADFQELLKKVASKQSNLPANVADSAPAGREKP